MTANNLQNNQWNPPANDAVVADWIATKMAAVADLAKDKKSYLLAHADDGVIWGKYESGQFLTSTTVAPNAKISPELRGITIQQAFLFNSACELRLFHDELGAWQCMLVQDSEPSIDEWQVLWGDRAEQNFNADFTHLRDVTQQGLDHIVPIKIENTDLEKGERGKLLLRHFIQFDDDTGEARIAYSRLVDVEKDLC
ncbi:MAG: TIGR03984 family CRISPR-associated protein [Calditrichaeota bacterium]|nr:MAG: TIGR03984 family CRISPR-associated protein [Calditrichota bacterium]